MFWRTLTMVVPLSILVFSLSRSSSAADKIECSQRSAAFLELDIKYGVLRDDISDLMSKSDVEHSYGNNSGICQKIRNAKMLSDEFSRLYDAEYKSQCGPWSYFFSSTIEEASELDALFSNERC